jgi:glycosyltransferase involved in cell wall biosynthesis
VQHRVAELGIGARVVFKPLVPSDRLAESLGLADVAVVTLRPGFEGLIVPSKLLGYMARGIPTLYIGPRSDVSELLEMCDGGVVCANDDVAGVEAALRLALSEREQWRARGTQAYEYYREHLTRENSLAQYRELVATMTNQLDRP